MIDIDSFKNIMTITVMKGDAVLKIVARILCECCGGITDKIVRYGGRVPHYRGYTSTASICRKIIHKMAVENIEHKYRG